MTRKLIKFDSLANSVGAASAAANMADGAAQEARDAAAEARAHPLRTDNPHGTTAAQVGALAATGGKLTGPLQTREIRAEQRTARPMMTFIDDDGGLPTYTTFFPLLQAKGVPGCAAIVDSYISPNVDARKVVGGTPMMTAAEIHALQDAGWEIASHTVTHQHMTALPEAQAEAEIRDSLTLLKARGFAVESLVYPFSDNDALVRRLVRKYYRAAFGQTAEYQRPPLATFQIRRKVIDSLTEAQLIAAIDAAIAQGAWLIWSCHTYRPEYTPEFFAALGNAIDYAKAQGVEIVTPRQGLDVFANLLDQGDPESGERHLRVDALGRPDDLVVIPTVIDSSAPITAYPNRCTSVMAFNASAGNWPTNIGTVLTHRTGLSQGSDYQLVTTRNSGQVWRRAWDEVNNKWRDWHDVKVGPAAITATLDFGNFTAHQVKTQYVNMPGLVNGDIAIGQPQNGYGGQIHWCVSGTSDGRIEVRLTNASAEPITPGSRAWWFTAIKRFP